MTNFDYSYQNNINIANLIKQRELEYFPQVRDYILHNIVNIVGTSLDTKPIPCGTGSTFYEIDTCDLYVLTNSYSIEDGTYSQEWVISPIPESDYSDPETNDDNNGDDNNGDDNNGDDNNGDDNNGDDNNGGDNNGGGGEA